MPAVPDRIQRNQLNHSTALPTPSVGIELFPAPGPRATAHLFSDCRAELASKPKRSAPAHMCALSRPDEGLGVVEAGHRPVLRDLNHQAEPLLSKAEVKPAHQQSSSFLHRKVVIFEVHGGADKGPDGHRRDTLPIVDALRQRGWDAEVLFYSDADRPQLVQHCLASADAFLARVNPGSPGYSEADFLEMGRQLHAAGVQALQHPDAMLSFGAKDSLVKLRHLATGLPDTECYYHSSQFLEAFPTHLVQSDRVLKQNRGSAGEGIWVVKPHGWERREGLVLQPDCLVECTEMKDNATHTFRLGDFMEMCLQYIEGENGLLVDQRFLPRIVEGEVRVLMILDQPVAVVHKKPAEGQLSATLFSGARYTYDSTDDPKWQPLLKSWLESLPQVREVLGAQAYPLIWTADFILDWAEGGGDAYRLGELNASCVGFTTHLELAEDVADAIIGAVTAHKALAAQA